MAGAGLNFMGNSMERALSQREIESLLVPQGVGQKMLGLLLGNVYSLICLLAGDGTFLYVSPAIMQLTGRPADEVFGLNVLDTIHPVDRKPFSQAILSALAGCTNTVIEYRQNTADGGHVWCEAHLTPIGEPSSSLLMVQMHDVSDRKVTETLLQDSERRKSAMLEASLDAVIGTDSYGVVLEWNASATEMFGYPKAVALGKNIADLIMPGHLKPRHLEAIERHRNTGIGHIAGKRVELTAMHCDRHTFPVELTVVPVELTGQKQYIAFIRNLTVQHTVLKRLQERERQVQQVVSQLPVILWTTDLELRLTAAVGTGMNEMDVKASDFIGRNVEEILSSSPVVVQAIQIHRHALNGQSGSYAYQRGHQEFDVHVEPFRNEADQIIGCLSLAVDVTDRHLAQLYESDKTRVLETIAVGNPLETTLDLITTLLERQRPGSIGQILIHRNHRLELASSPRLPEEMRAILTAGVDIGLDKGSCSSAAFRGRPHITPDIRTDPAWEIFGAVAGSHGLRACWAVPVLASDQSILGTLSLYFSSPRTPNEADMELLAGGARLAGIAMERARNLENISNTREETLRALGLALEFRDYETKGHTDRVVRLSLALADQLQVAEADRNALRWGAYLHDVGKIVVPDQILLKPGKPTQEEWLLIQRHPEIGFEMLKNIPALPAATLEIVRHHHERWDGGGYPSKLSAEAIPWLARLFSVVDIYDALTSVRPYKAAWTHADAAAELRRISGQALDPAMVEAFLGTDLGDSETEQGAAHSE